MHQCKNCRNEIERGKMMRCPNCSAEICADCAGKSRNICPYCYSDLDIFG